MTRSKVAVLKTTPQTVLEDYGKLMRLADYGRYLPKDKDTALKINISWHYYYPACSTPPWQLEGVIKTLLEDGYSRDRLHACHNKTVVVSARRGEVANKQLPVVQKYRLRNIHLYEGEDWVCYEPKAKMRVLHEIYPRGIEIPKRLIGENVLHLPTMKTHVFTTMTGAMKNAFGGLLHEKRHWTHSVIHETLVDLLAIQKEIHTGIFAFMDGTTVGNGPGPRTMFPVVKDYILASADQVAIDAVAAKMMGFDPMSLEYIRVAHGDGLGVGDVREIEVVGADISRESWGFHVGNNGASMFGNLAWFGPLKFAQNFFFRTPMVHTFIFASEAYHDYYRWPVKDRRVFEQWRVNTHWGKLFQTYEQLQPEPVA